MTVRGGAFGFFAAGAGVRDLLWCLLSRVRETPARQPPSGWDVCSYRRCDIMTRGCAGALRDPREEACSSYLALLDTSKTSAVQKNAALLHLT